MGHTKKPLLIAIIGPTASGKSVLAVSLARRFGGEIISADSRQVYRGLDIGTGKITKREMRGIPHHLLGIVSPKKQFDVAAYRIRALRAAKKIRRKHKLPFLVGGTGLYIDAVARGLSFPDIPPNPTLRARLSKHPAVRLFQMLKRLDPARAKTIDRENPRRLIRAIEIGKADAISSPCPPHPPFSALFIGIRREPEVLRARIQRAVERRLRRGLLKETARLMKTIPRKRLAELGLDYRIAAEVLRGTIPKSDLKQRLSAANWHYAKRQLTWLKRHSDIHWVANAAEATRLIRRFGATT